MIQLQMLLSRTLRKLAYIRESDFGLIFLSDIVNKPAKKVVKWAPKLAPGGKCL